MRDISFLHFFLINHHSPLDWVDCVHWPRTKWTEWQTNGEMETDSLGPPPIQKFWCRFPFSRDNLTNSPKKCIWCIFWTRVIESSILRPSGLITIFATYINLHIGCFAKWTSVAWMAGDWWQGGISMQSTVTPITACPPCHVVTTGHFLLLAPHLPLALYNFIHPCLLSFSF